jgi:hypothetical protein
MKGLEDGTLLVFNGLPDHMVKWRQDLHQVEHILTGEISSVCSLHRIATPGDIVKWRLEYNVPKQIKI